MAAALGGARCLPGAGGWVAGGRDMRAAASQPPAVNCADAADPAPALRCPSQIRRLVLEGARPTVPPTADLPGHDTASFARLDAYIQLMGECWSPAPEQRPSFEQIVPRLRALQQ